MATVAPIGMVITTMATVVHIGMEIIMVTLGAVIIMLLLIPPLMETVFQNMLNVVVIITVVVLAVKRVHVKSLTIGILNVSKLIKNNKHLLFKL